MLHVKSARYVSGLKLWISFDDGSSGEVDLSGKVNGPIFEAIQDPEVFSKVTVDPELETVIWPNGPDLAPEFFQGLLHS